MKNVPINFDCIPARFQRAANFQSLRGIRSTNKTKFHIKSLQQIFIWKFEAQGSETAYVSQSLWCTRWSRNCYLCGDRFMEQPRPCLLNQRHLSSASVPPRRPTVLKHCEEAGKKKIGAQRLFVIEWDVCWLGWNRRCFGLPTFLVCSVFLLMSAGPRRWLLRTNTPLGQMWKKLQTCTPFTLGTNRKFKSDAKFKAVRDRDASSSVAHQFFCVQVTIETTPARFQLPTDRSLWPSIGLRTGSNSSIQILLFT